LAAAPLPAARSFSQFALNAAFAASETTALGAAYLAGLKAGLCPDFDGFAKTWKLDRRFSPQMDPQTRDRKWRGWQDAVRRTLSTVEAKV
jgi:glycerol kinase